MPMTISVYAVGVWFFVGFATGAGWALGTAVVARILRPKG